MTDDNLTKFVCRINTDDNFRVHALEDPAAALGEYRLCAAQSIALSSDEDALRRLAAIAEPNARVWTWVKRKLSKLFCGPGRTRSWECTNAPPR